MERRNPESSQLTSGESGAPKEEGAKAPEAKPEVAETALSPEQQEQADYWMEQIAKEEAAAAEVKKSPEQVEVEKKESELRGIFDTWLVPEKLDTLHELKTQKEAMESPLRQEAKKALAEITKRGVRDESSPWIEEYRKLSRAVGMINSGEVDHTR